MIDSETNNWIEYPEKQFLTKQTAQELLIAQEKMIFDLEERLQRALNQCDLLDRELIKCKNEIIDLHGWQGRGNAC